ncbi:MAG: sulfurtransferase [Gemmatimonadetes bacterium]|nr:sulfurtransferase [Gemmatimonadota bacterium]
MVTRYTTLITVDRLVEHLGDPSWAMVDCRYRLADLGFGRAAYAESHIAGAVFADIGDDLSGPVVPGKTGRHPLPDVAALSAKFSAWGIDEAVQVVAYDDSGGSMAARMWWLLRWLGHDGVAVLDGGWPTWAAAGWSVQAGVEGRKVRRFVPRERPESVLTAEQVEEVRADPAWRLLDARSADRFRGENETIDPVAGHIPGAVSAPYADNLEAAGRFKSPKELRRRYLQLLDGVPADRAACYCGSGVTAAHEVLAMAYAGLGEAKLYAGSWSEWITDGSRPVAAG